MKTILEKTIDKEQMDIPHCVSVVCANLIPFFGQQYIRGEDLERQLLIVFQFNDYVYASTHFPDPLIDAIKTILEEQSFFKLLQDFDNNLSIMGVRNNVLEFSD